MALGALASAGIGLLGIASNIGANHLNEEANLRNYSLAVAQQRFQRESFNRQLHFNSPVTQAKLLRAGGMNPALMNSGLAGSVSAGSSAGIPSNMPIQPLDLGGLNGIASNIGLLDSQKEKNMAEAKNTSVLTETSLLKRQAELDKLLSDKDLTDEMRSYYQEQKSFTQKLLKYQDEKSEWENHNLRLEAINKTLQNEALTIQNTYLPMLNVAQARNLVSSAYLNYMTGKLHGESINKIKQEVLNEVIHGGILNNEFLKGLPEGLKGEQLANALKKHPKFKRLETAIDLLLNRLNSLPVSFSVGVK